MVCRDNKQRQLSKQGTGEAVFIYASYVRRRLNWLLALQQGQVQFLGAKS